MGGTLKNSNFFDAIAYSHSNRVLFFMEHCMKLYFESESELDYTFESREDFIRTVFGDDRVEGGIKSSKVFQILRQYDSAKPLEPVYLNPFRRMLFKHVQTSHW